MNRKQPTTKARQQPLTVADIRSLIVFGVLFAAAIYLAIRFFSAIAGVLLLFGLITLFTLILSPIPSWLERYRVPRYLTAVLIVLTAVGSVIALVWYAYPIVSGQAIQLFEEMPGYVRQVDHWLAKHAAFLGIGIAGAKSAGIFGQPESILARLGTYTLTVLDILAGAVMVIIGTIYALARPRPLVDGFLRLLKPEQTQRAAEVLAAIGSQLRVWAYSVLASMLAVFGLTWMALGLVIGMPFALLFALIAGLLEVVPTVGPVLSSIPPLIIAATQSTRLFIWVLVAYLIIHQIENHIIAPVVLSRGARLHPVSIVFSFATLTLLFGIVGAFLAAPVAATVRILVNELYLKPRDRHRQELESKIEPIVSGQEAANEGG